VSAVYGVQRKFLLPGHASATTAHAAAHKIRMFLRNTEPDLNAGGTVVHLEAEISFGTHTKLLHNATSRACNTNHHSSTLSLHSAYLPLHNLKRKEQMQLKNGVI